MNNAFGIGKTYWSIIVVKVQNDFGVKEKRHG